MNSTDRVPCEMLRDEAGLDAPHEPSEPLEGLFVEPFRASERKPDAMQLNRVVSPYRVEMPQRRSAAEVVFGMNLEPRDAGPVCADRRVMREAQPDPRPRGDRAARVPVHRGNHGQERLPQEAWVLPPANFWQSPFGTSTNEAGSRSRVDWPTHECAPSPQSFLPRAATP